MTTGELKSGSDDEPEIYDAKVLEYITYDRSVHAQYTRYTVYRLPTSLCTHSIEFESSPSRRQRRSDLYRRDFHLQKVGERKRRRQAKKKAKEREARECQQREEVECWAREGAACLEREAATIQRQEEAD